MKQLYLLLTIKSGSYDQSFVDQTKEIDDYAKDGAPGQV